MAILLKCGGLFLHVPKTGRPWVSVLEAHDLLFAHVGRRYDLAWAFPASFDSTHLMMRSVVAAVAPQAGP